jgi:hypothetical protein
VGVMLKNLSKIYFIIFALFFISSSSMNTIKNGLFKARTGLEALSHVGFQPKIGSSAGQLLAANTRLHCLLQRTNKSLGQELRGNISLRLNSTEAENALTLRKNAESKFALQENGLFESLKNHKVIILCGVLGVLSTVGIVEAYTKLNLDEDNLFDIMKCYKTTNTSFHSGDLFEHSVWVAKCINNWFKTKNYWVEGLSDADRSIAVISGFLHDIGKAGDLKYVYYDKHEHPRDGFLYLLNKKKFYVSKDECFNFDNFFKKLNISEDDRKLIAILVGIHWSFGGIVVKGVYNGKSRTKVFTKFLNKLKLLVVEANYNNGLIDERLLRLAILINAADLKGAGPICSCCDDSPVELPENCEPKYDALNMYEKFNMDSAGQALRKELILFFKK